MNSQTDGKPAAGAPPVTLRAVPAVRRGVAILYYLAGTTEERGVSRIARDLNMLPSTCLHILRELVAGGLVTFDAARKTYALGLGVLTLSRQFSRKHTFAQLAQPHLERIAREFNVKVTASENDGFEHIVVVAGTDSDEDVHVQIPVGRRVPLLASSTGRCVAAFSDIPVARIRPLFDNVRWQNPIPFELWQEEVRAASVNGVAFDDGWYRRGLTIISAPVYGADGTVSRFIGALAVSEQLVPARREALGQALKAAALEIGGSLGYAASRA